ncbi:hypothetical protein DLAC_10259 [Tieghemostelium lacteum]|uniref:N-acetyltransferase domain-containing protein n=1 Tax=Tieghemostelium lacteum TaxID=361077 RepID=A0A151Z520_TIELA|nr:hypothetical protein DLAC_10259 [Tieghemostelium lacteum]|eukprot:KYQ89035.1 hypothetical protein DLAC_10259 [Tieghemostelium lacteum]
MTEPQLYKLNSSHAEKIIYINTKSFEKDPYVNYMYYEITNEAEKLQFNRYLQGAFVNQTIDYDSSYSLGEDIQTMALLLPPHKPWPEDRWEEFTKHQEKELLSRGLTTTFERFVQLEEFLSEKFCQFNAIEGYYLLILSTDHRFQGKGLGSKMLNQLFKIFDAEQKSCYLECTSLYMVPFYQKHGFKILGQDMLPKVGDIPDDKLVKITFLRRDPEPLQ